jgi:hypothetical protein
LQQRLPYFQLEIRTPQVNIQWFAAVAIAQVKDGLD